MRPSSGPKSFPPMLIPHPLPCQTPQALTSLLEVALVFYLCERWLASTADEACTACSLLWLFKATFLIVLKHGPVPAPARWDPQFRKKRGVSFPSLVLSPRECEFIASACARCARQGFTDQDWSFSLQVWGEPAPSNVGCVGQFPERSCSASSD